MGKLEQDLSRHDIVGVDSAPFLYLWERHPRYLALSEIPFRHLKQPQAQGITSVITLIEACVLPQRQGRPDLVQAYEEALHSSEQIRMLPIDVEIARQAIILRAHCGIKTPDALQFAAAIEARATAFVTNDRRLAQVGEIQVYLVPTVPVATSKRPFDCSCSPPSRMVAPSRLFSCASCLGVTSEIHYLTLSSAGSSGFLRKPACSCRGACCTSTRGYRRPFGGHPRTVA